MKTIRILSWILVLVAVVGLGSMIINWYAQELDVQKAQSGQGLAKVGGSFTLTDHTGKLVTAADYSDKPMAIYFGYTFCPDVCPTTFADMIGWREELGADADKINYLFITVDPERDTQEAMAEYVSVFFPTLVGLRGTQEQLDEAIKAYRVYAKKSESEDYDNYVMDHTASVYLMKPGNEFMGTISYGEAHDSAVGKMRKLLATIR